MKGDIHPKYFPEASVTCSCGNVFAVGSTKESIKVEICSACHPFYTGEGRVVDTAGRVEKFKERLSKASATPRVKKISKAAKKVAKEK